MTDKKPESSSPVVPIQEGYEFITPPPAPPPRPEPGKKGYEHIAPPQPPPSSQSGNSSSESTNTSE